MFHSFSRGEIEVKEGEVEEEKKKRPNLSVKEKLVILERLDKEKCSITKIAQEYGLSDTTLRRWRRKRKELQNFDNQCTNTNNKRMKCVANLHLNQALYIWFSQSIRQGRTITGPVLKGKAIDLNRQLGGNGTEAFSASDGWLSNWKAKYGVRLPVGIAATKTSFTGAKSVEDFKRKFTGLEIDRENLTKSQIFSCDEASLNYKLMPYTCFSIKQEEDDEEVCVEFRKNNDGVKLMACSNVDGTLKLPLVVIGRSADPASLKNIRRESLPVYYMNERNLCVTSSNFANWFTEQFVPRVSQFLLDRCQPVKAVLLLEHSASHLFSKSLSVGQIKAIFLPPNVTSIIQPVDQGILQNLRMRYKLKLLKSVLNAQDDGIDINTHLNTVTIRDVIYWISAAWNEVSGDTIRDSCKELVPQMFETKTESPSIERDKLFHNILNIVRRISGYHDANAEDVENWIANEVDETSEELTDLQIVQRVMGCANDPVDHDTEIENSIEEPPVNATEALQGLECAIRFFEQRGILSLTDMSVILKAKDKVLTEKINIF